MSIRDYLEVSKQSFYQLVITAEPIMYFILKNILDNVVLYTPKQMVRLQQKCVLS